ncbi:MAG: hypothetical protein L6W00_13000 [Lentisphaeria bacterium]|nr:MAG: hypothetical protein L6W00_13000 [Lentisphaeria bacterium]
MEPVRRLGKGPKLKATGFFRVERCEGKWYFVDPEGRLFFSRGVNSVRLSSSWSLPKTAGREALYSGDRQSRARRSISSSGTSNGNTAVSTHGRPLSRNASPGGGSTRSATGAIPSSAGTERCPISSTSRCPPRPACRGIRRCGMCTIRSSPAAWNTIWPIRSAGPATIPSASAISSATR